MHKHFPYLPQNALRKIYKSHCKRLCLIMINGIPFNICWLTEAKFRLASEFSDPFVSYMPGFSESIFAKKKELNDLAQNVSIVYDLVANDRIVNL